MMSPITPIAVRLAQLLIRTKCQIAAWALPWAKILIIDHHLPDRIGRYRIINTLIVWAEEQKTITPR